MKRHNLQTNEGLYDASTSIFKVFSYAYNYYMKRLPSSEMKRWDNKLTMVDLIKFGQINQNPKWEQKIGGYEVYTGKWDEGIHVILKANNNLNINSVRNYDYGNYKNEIVIWLGRDGMYNHFHTGGRLCFPTTSSMQKAWEIITSRGGWLYNY